MDYLFTNANDRTEYSKFLQSLAKTDNMTYFSSPTIQRLIEFRWDKLVRRIYYTSLSVFCFSFILILISSSLLHQEPGSKGEKVRQGINIFNCVLIYISVLSYEGRQLYMRGKEYFYDLWNINDILFLVIYTATIVCDFKNGTSKSHGSSSESTRIMYAILIVTTFIKFLSLARIFNNFSFIVKMLIIVISEIVPFILLFLLFIIAFAFCMMILDIHFEEDDPDNPYSGLGHLAYPLFIFRTSLGDIDVDVFKQLTPWSKYAAWIFWLIIVFCNLIVFLNFLIAVISDVYEQVMENRMEEVIQKKVQLLIDVEEVYP